MVTKQQAIDRLRNEGYDGEADALDAWRNNRNNNWGWDGWIRGEYPYVIQVIWPGEENH